MKGYNINIHSVPSFRKCGKYSGGSSGPAPPPPPLFLDQIEGLKGRKKILGRPGPPLSKGLDDCLPPLSQGLDPALK